MDGHSWVRLGHHLRRLEPGFDARTYGHSQLSPLVKANTKLFDIREEKGEEREFGDLCPVEKDDKAS